MKKTLSIVFIALLVAGATSVKAQDAKIENSKKVENKAVTPKKIRKKINVKDVQVQKIQPSNKKTTIAPATQPVKAKGITPSKSVNQPANAKKATIKNLDTNKPLSKSVKKAKINKKKED